MRNAHLHFHILKAKRAPNHSAERALFRSGAPPKEAMINSCIAQSISAYPRESGEPGF
jgi:hypothetical protein